MSLKQALDMIEEGMVFVIYTAHAMRAFVKNIENLDLDAQTVAYFDCNYMPGFLGDGEWEYYLTQPEGNSEITDTNIRERLAEQKDIPHREYYSANR